MFALRYQDTGEQIMVGAGLYDREAVPWRARHATTARRSAAHYAAASGRPVEVLRGDRVSYVVLPDGRVSAPDGVLVPDRAVCTRDSGQPCFCAPCRAERKAARR